MKCLFLLGEICRKALKSDQDYVCTSTKHCKAFNESIRTRNYLDICKFVGLQSIVCCPTPITANERLTKNGRSISADESMATHSYSHITKLILYIYMLHICYSYTYTGYNM